MAKSEAPLKIHVAKAKDLPLSWYELILRPDKFADHLKVLQENRRASPTATNLMITFLDKAGVYGILSNNKETLNKSLKVTGEKEMKLVKCALLMASSLHWDFTQCGDELPLSVQYCLVSLLRDHYPDPEVGVANTEEGVARAIFSEWVLRFVINECHASTVQPRPPVQTWDATCVPTDQIKDLVKQSVEYSLSYLTDFLRATRDLAGGDLPDQWPLPRVSVDLPVLSGGEVHLEPLPVPEEGEEHVPSSRKLCELEFTVGCYHFTEGQYSLAYQHLQHCRQLQAGCKGRCHVDEGKLAGFVVACEGMLGEGRGGRGEEVEEVSLATALEECLRAGDHEGVVKILVKDIGRNTLPSELLTSLEQILARSEGDKEGVEPVAKRPRLDADSSALLGVGEKVTICSSVRRVLEGLPPPPQFWTMLASGNTAQHMEFLLQLCERVLSLHVAAEVKLRLQTFVRSVCSGVYGGASAWDLLLSSKLASQLTLSQDSESCKQLFTTNILTSADRPDHTPDHTPTSVENMERNIVQAITPQEVMEGVGQVFGATPISQHRAFALKWSGSSRGFSPVEGLADPQTVTKYNCLVHRAQSLARSQCYVRSVQMLQAAQSILNSGSFLNSKAWLQLLDYVDEQLLMAELMRVQRGRARLEFGSAVRETAIVAKAKSYYVNNHSWVGPDAHVLYIVSAFLLNTQELPLLIKFEGNHSTNIPMVPPRLAEAVIEVKQGRDLRKCTRSLFEAVVSVFSPLLHGNEGKAEVNERQSKLRANIDLFVQNLSDPTALSLLTAALARIWNLLKKPEEDILTEFNGHWPTAIGNAANIDAGHVFRMLNTSLSHAHHLYPQSSSWIIIKANLHSAVCEYGAVLEGYMEAAALTSSHFHHEVPDSVWSQVTLRQLVKCCCRLGYFTQAVLLTQLLRPVDYELAFRIMKENAGHMTEGMFRYFWDMTIIEYLIHVHSKKTDSHKQTAAIQVAGQADLNFNNSVDVLRRAAEVRRRKFLRAFYTQITHAI